MESVRIFPSEEPRKTYHHPEAEYISPAMVENLIGGSQNTVCHLALEGEMPQNYENHHNLNSCLQHGPALTGIVKSSCNLV